MQAYKPKKSSKSKKQWKRFLSKLPLAGKPYTKAQPPCNIRGDENPLPWFLAFANTEVAKSAKSTPHHPKNHASNNSLLGETFPNQYIKKVITLTNQQNICYTSDI